MGSEGDCLEEDLRGCVEEKIRCGLLFVCVCVNNGCSIYVCMWKNWHVYRETGMFLEDSCACVCGGRDRGCGRRKNVVWGCVCVEKGLLCMEGVSG